MADGLFVGHVDEDGEEREASYRCRRCNADEGSLPQLKERSP
jgi:hypothetical protein